MYESVKPIVLKQVLEKFGYRLEAADDISWLMKWECGGHLVNIPQTMAMVPSDVLEAMLDSSSDISARRLSTAWSVKYKRAPLPNSLALAQIPNNVSAALMAGFYSI